MRNHLIFLYLGFGALSLNQNLYAQSVASDTSLHQRAIASALKKVPRNQKGLFFGTSYYGVRYDIKKGHPFFSSDLPLEGNLIYNGVRYPDEEFQYDILRDEVIFEHWTGQKIMLIRENIEQFTLQGHTFIYITNQDLEQGFYELLAVSGEVELIARREKKMKGDPKVDAPYFIEATKYYLKKGGIFYRVKNSAEILNLLSDNRKIGFAILKKDSETEMIDAINQNVTQR
jgi:hypothetical protein